MTVYEVYGGLLRHATAGVYTTRARAEKVRAMCQARIREHVLDQDREDLAKYTSFVSKGDCVMLNGRRVYLTTNPWLGWQGLVAWASNVKDPSRSKTSTDSYCVPVAGARPGQIINGHWGKGNCVDEWVWTDEPYVPEIAKEG